jgi:hypothetical protein
MTQILHIQKIILVVSRTLRTANPGRVSANSHIYAHRRLIRAWSVKI